MENSIIVYGASGHGKVIVDLLKKSKIQVKAIIDDTPKFNELLGQPIQKAGEFEWISNEKVILAIGNNRVRKKLAGILNVSFVTIVHPTAIISDFTNIAEGTVVMAGAILNSDVKIGKHCIINTGAIIEHDCIIEDFVHVSPNASLAGGVKIGEGTQVGIGAVIIQGIKIGKWATIGAGAVIIRDVPDNAVVVGNPGRIIKVNENE